jgi:hypothetical protein
MDPNIFSEPRRDYVICALSTDVDADHRVDYLTRWDNIPAGTQDESECASWNAFQAGDDESRRAMIISSALARRCEW